MKRLEACLDTIRAAYDELQSVRDEEESAFDNLPEGIQMGERGDLMQEAIDILYEACDSLDSSASFLDEAITSVDRDLIMEHDFWEELKVGDLVNHKSWGQGVITKREGAYITVAFEYKSAMFKIPGSFETGHLTI